VVAAFGSGRANAHSDDRAWLAYAVAHYVRATGDPAVLKEVIPFLEGQLLLVDEHDSFFHPTISDEVGTLFEHCARGLDASVQIGVHGLPLIGTGDWNDGLNRVGEDGRGESVWLGWLLYATLNAFAPLAEERGDAARANKRGGRTQTPCKLRWNAQRGMASGTAAHGSTTAPRSVQRARRSAGLMQFRSPGQ
jgi:cyclic beta-1,2-glucan synthetase